ncbi:MAG: FRG domain-containing protein [Oscillospiraceae bacterium]|nr:FRG domain-containing protein [Oscillospiraceae bacterium]
MKRADIIINSYDGVDAVIEQLNSLARKNAYVFRGYGKQEELLPVIIRDKIKYQDVEGDLLENFERYGSNYFHANTPIDFMSYAQHFGLPTRLLDFTYNPFIALSFSLCGAKSPGKYKSDEDKTYYYIRYASIDDNLCVPSIPLSDDIYQMKFIQTESLAKKAVQCIDSVEDLFGANNLNRNVTSLTGYSGLDDNIANQQKIRDCVILFVTPNQSNQRIIMQQGLFMFPYTLDKYEHHEILDRNTSVIKIHKDLRNELIQYLDTLGYNTFRLMPDLTSICGAVKRRIIDERKDKSPNFKKKGASNK